MAAIFKYNDKIYQCMSLDKKLKRLKIDKDDIDILLERDLTQSELEKEFINLTRFCAESVLKEIKLYQFKNRITGETIISIYSTLDNLSNLININDYDVYK